MSSSTDVNWTRDEAKAVDFEMRVAEIHAQRAAELLRECGLSALHNELQEDVIQGIAAIRSVCAYKLYKPSEK